MNARGEPDAGPDLPSGTVTFLFTDVEGSTRLLHELGEEAYAEALAEHRRLLRAAFTAHDGVEVDTQGDAFFVAFPTAPGALAAADALTHALADGPIRVRVGLHTGTPLVTDEGYVGSDVHRAARIAACGHGGQILVSATTAPLVNSDQLHDLGQHRLKDLSAAERIHQLGDGDFPPLKSLYRTNLPIPATPFLGREAELRAVCDLLARDDVRLLTLTGTGGTGKTRLALQSAGALADRYPDGVYWVPLAPLRDPQLVLKSAAEALEAADGLAEHVADRRLLLLLDNFEHLVDAAVDVADVLGRCPNLDVLVTSREPLHVAGEHEYAVPPLEHAQAVDFFAARARAIDPAFVADDVVGDICRRLDDLPLALELAAARVKALTTEQLLERLDRRLPVLTGGRRDLPERQRTLRTTIEWSHDLLTDDERRLFARLAVFRGGCTLEAADAVVDAELDTIQSLVDKSLVRRTGERFWMLETIREYALEQLDAAGEAHQLRRRHAQRFLELAETADPIIAREWAEGGRTWLDRLESELDELRAALDTFEESGDAESALRLAGSLSDFWISRGHAAEGRDRIERALAAECRGTGARARALTGAADLAAVFGDTATVRRRAAEALELYPAAGDVQGIATSTHMLGYAAVEEHDTETGIPLLEEANRLFAELGDEHMLLWGTRTLAFAFAVSGDLARSRALYEDALGRARALGSRAVEGALLGSLSWTAVKQERMDEALSYLQESLVIKRDVGERTDIGQALCRSARVFASLGDMRAAALLLACFDASLDEIGSGEAWVARMNAETRALLDGAGDVQTLVEARDEGSGMTLEDGLAFALGVLERRAGDGR